MSVSYWQDRRPSKKKNADITIIGGGIAGASTAYWLAKEDPSLNICLLEKHFIASGASGRNAGFITCGSVEHFNRLARTHGKEMAKKIWSYSEDNLSLLKDEIFCELNFESVGFEQKGSFSLASTESEMKELEETHQLMKELDIEVEKIQDFEVAQRLGVKGFVGGIKYVSDGSVHPVKLVDSIFEKAKQRSHNLEICTEAEVFSIEPNNTGYKVRARGMEVDTDVVVLATNGYSYQLSDFFSDKIFPTRGQILATKPLPPFLEAPCYANFVLDYFRQLPSGEVIIGGFRQLQKDVEKGVSDEISPVIQEALDKFMKDHIPQAAQVGVTHRWSGIMGFSTDGQLMVGSLPTLPGVYYLGGFTAHGLGLAFHAGKSLVDLLMGRPIPEFISGKRFN